LNGSVEGKKTEIWQKVGLAKMEKGALGCPDIIETRMVQ
jgi:hypothetical protein